MEVTAKIVQVSKEDIMKHILKNMILTMVVFYPGATVRKTPTSKHEVKQDV